MAETTVEERRARYERVLGAATQLDQFTASEIQRQSFEARPTFVSRILNQLAAEGVLQESVEGTTSQFRWKRRPEQFSIEGWIERQICGKQITQTPMAERPRERLMRCGAENLRTAELLAILIRTGRKGESALEAGERIANRAGERLDAMRGWSAAEYKEVSRVVSDTAFCQIMAGIELGRRVAEAMGADREPPMKINSSLAAIDYCCRTFARLAVDRRQEEFHIVTLDTKLFPIRTHQITIGTLDASLVHPREVFRAAIRDAASSVLLVHNHPSGDPTPSREDFEVTQTLETAGKILGIHVIDHIVVGGSTAVSIGQLRSR
ncbi:MAG: DNA repair protein RadC [Pirellulaceae bacterium]|nr:DNA repair protein RadC [Pirellulaceae bacterium]